MPSQGWPTVARLGFVTELTKKDVKAAAAVGDLTTLSVALGSRNDRLRRGAIKALQSMGTSEAADVLAERAQSEYDPVVQEDAARALTKLGDPRAGVANRRTLWLQGLIDEEPGVTVPARTSRELLREPVRTAEDRPVQRRAARAPLPEAGDIGALVGVVADEQRDRGERCDAIAELARSRDTRAGPALMAAAGSASTLVAARATSGLGKLGDREAVPLLVEALRIDGRPQVRRAAAQALGLLADPASADALTRAGSDEDLLVRSEAASALDRLQTVTRWEGRLRSPKEDDQVEAVHALVRLGPDVAVPRLIDATGWLTPGSPAHLEVAYALDEIDRPDAAAALESLIASGVPLCVARTPTIISDPSLRWSLEQRLRPEEHPVFVAYDLPGRPGSPGPGTTLVALEDRLLVHRTGTTSSMTIDGVERQVPDISEVPYGDLTELTVHFPEQAKGVSSGETVAAGLLGGMILGSVALTILDAMRQGDRHSWIVLRGDDMEIELGGEAFLARGQSFLRWLRERINTAA